MRIEALWRELELETRPGANTWLTRYALPEASTPLLVGFETERNRRALLLPILTSEIPAKREWPYCHGLELFACSLDGHTHIGVRLLDAAFVDVFVALAEDVAPRVAAAANSREAATALLARLRRWQKFLAVAAGGLSLERQRGLFGELYAMRELLLHVANDSRVVQAWRSPHRSHQDFQFSAVSLEVKTTVSKQPIAIRVTSERQLDATGARSLFLYVLILDEREIEPSSGTSGESLPELVRQLRKQLSYEALETFEDRLLEYGYLEGDVPRYESRHFAKRQGRAFAVSTGFPRLTEADLPDGIGDVSYELTLAACEPFAIDFDNVLAAIRAAFE
jgi:hypothetical protein